MQIYTLSVKKTYRLKIEAKYLSRELEQMSKVRYRFGNKRTLDLVF